MSRIMIEGMHGLGDNLHQRGLLKQLLAMGHEVHLASSWIAPYHDLIDDLGLKVFKRPTTLRTQTKNAYREEHKFSTAPQKPDKVLRISYSGEQVRAHKSVLGAMCASIGVDYTRVDFRMPVPDAWKQAALAKITAANNNTIPDKPILFYRPLVARTEWTGCGARNPDQSVYAELLKHNFSDYFIVSIADLVPGKEWLVGTPIRDNIRFHSGELNFEELAGLMALSDVAYTSPGFAVPLAQAISTPVVCIFGGYERSYSFSGGARFSHYLGIDPIKPCDCFAHNHKCDKRIDIPRAHRAIVAFKTAMGSPFVAPLLPPPLPPVPVEIKPPPASPALPRLLVVGQNTLPFIAIRWGSLERRYMNPGEIEVLAALYKKHGIKSVLEIGVNEGRTARLMLDNVRSIERYVGIDVFPGYQFKKEVQRAEVPKQPGYLAGNDPRFTLIVRNQGSIGYPVEYLGEFDAVFIDGDHSYAAVHHDTELATKLNPKLIVWHDYHDLGTVDVREVMHELLAKGRKIYNIDKTWFAFEVLR